MEDAVTVTAISTVTPAKPILPYLHFLSNLDLAWASLRFYLQNLFYFRAKSHPPNRENVIESLKKSLSETLSHFPIVAGRLKLGHDGRLVVDVNSAGIPFIEATSRISLDDWSDLKNAPFNYQCNPRENMIRDQFRDPLLRVQVTRFRCGGIAIGLGVCHTLFDAHSVILFAGAWGQIHQRRQISREPNAGSVLLKARSPPIVDVPIPDFIAKLFPCGQLGPKASSSNSEPKPVQITFTIDASKVEECIEEASDGSAKASSFQALTALVWRCITRARGLPSNSITHISFPVDLRRKKRWDPALQQSFFGNGMQITLASAMVEDLCSSRGLSFGAKMVKKSIKCLEGTGLARSLVDWLELLALQSLPTGLGDPLDATITTLVGFPVYDMDFGWGQLDHYICPPLGPAQASIMPTKTGDRSMEVAFCLLDAHMLTLLHDKEFAYYFQFQGHFPMPSKI